MPLYEYKCRKHGKFEKFKHRMSDLMEPCPRCGLPCKKIMSTFSWHMGWKFLKGKSEKSVPAPTDSGYHPEWDQAYAP